MELLLMNTGQLEHQSKWTETNYKPKSKIRNHELIIGL